MRCLVDQTIIYKNAVNGENPMKTKFKKLSLVSFVIAIVLFVFSFTLFHYLTPEGTFSNVWHNEASKPFLTFLFAVWGTLHLFVSVTSYLVSIIIF